MFIHSFARYSAALLIGAGLAASAQADTWPAKPITLIVPSASGGAADLSARTLAHFLTQKSGANVVVEDKPGAGGIIGTTAVKQAAPDGYTFLLSTNSTQSANQFLYKKLPYNAAQDFVDVGMLGKFGTVAVVAPANPINSLSELVASARQKPGKVFFGYYSSSSRVPPELLKHYAKIQIEGAAYKNVTQILTDLRGGLIQFAFVDYLTAMGQIEGKNLKPIAVTGAKPNPLWPNIATTNSAYPGFIVEGWLGISAPKGTPKAIVEKMNGYIKDAIQDPATRAQYTRLGLQPESMDVASFQAFVKEDVQRWKEWVKTAQIPAQ
ncbi:tripartite tricarboxylate transporter substrate binding protein [Paralcaligenes sp. KSB-10]|jgi:tripartite-type tricarboxylate transporter receptor subunit TctC|uniref:Bug family tripartite tricarboxylate transporter substrate binding protein n=1 Tax=Paralcaligenes sp. KSB-10 TaxID=2901142 RepID=UPI001E517D28|nr:tripartite tricarboxylate transporter substrate binding protein [Paralcaligenes sp. KSB-10]UHL62779.1 tripartite tricarboxylate transporter substrate binding protein [Paralcaligenes sp. KSB-10]